MEWDEKAIEVGLGTVGGVVTALTNSAAPHVRCLLRPPAAGAILPIPSSVGSQFNTAASVANAATRSFRQNHRVGVALTAAATAAVPAPITKAASAATKSFHQHHKVGTALAAGATAVLGHGVLATAAVAAAPVVAAVAVAGGAAYGLAKFVSWLRDA
jgi:hypothetical protein